MAMAMATAARQRQKSRQMWSHQGGLPGAMIFLTVLGICIILGTTACIYFLPKEEGNDGVRRLRYRPKHDRDPNRDRAQRDREQHDRDERRIGHDQGSAQQVTQERRSWRQEQQLQLQPDGHGRGGDAVWFKLTAASSPVRRHRCLSPPCREGKHVHAIWSDFAEEMALVQGAAVVRRPDLSKVSDSIAPAHTLDFVSTLQSYFPIFTTSLLPRKMFSARRTREQILKMKLHRFFDAVGKEDTTAGRYLSSYYTFTEEPKMASDGYEALPSVAGMADVFINNLGFFWNSKDLIAPKSCKSDTNGRSASMAIPTGAKRYKKVAILAAHWGDGYYHFVMEGLPRIMAMLDVLLEHRDIKIAVSAPAEDAADRKQYMYQFLELLGISRERIVFIEEPIFAELAFVPESTPCGKPNAALINMLRRALLQALYPSTLGVPPPLRRPTLVLIVRETKRGLRNHSKVREALEENFPRFDVVEFDGSGTTSSQLHLFATASFIVAPHGAGLSNAIVSPLHTPVLEIAPFTCPPCYLNLAVKLHHVYGRHPSLNRFSEACETWYEPDVHEVVSLVRDLSEAKRLADAADPPVSGRKPTSRTKYQSMFLRERNRR